MHKVHDWTVAPSVLWQKVIQQLSHYPIIHLVVVLIVFIGK